MEVGLKRAGKWSRTLRVRLAQPVLHGMIRFDRQVARRGLGDSLYAQATRPL